MLRSTYVSRTEPATEPITAAEVAEYLRIDYDDHDSMLSNYAKEARRTLEDGYLWKVCIAQACVDKFDGFDDDLELHYQPVSAITSITYTDTTGTTQTLASTVYELGQKRGIGYVRLKYGQTWPATRSHEDVVTVTYTAGYGTTSASVPEAIRQAIIMYAGHIYDNPTDPPPSWVLGRISPYYDPRCAG
jgi:uncharacterized phiE125 gp8 family phage protein